MHADQLTVSVDVVRRLVGDQFPRWRRLDVEAVSSTGTVNALFRIGDRLAARFPLVSAGVDQTRAVLEREAEAARELCGRTPVPTPRPVAIGSPGEGYPLPWAVQTWLPGTAATPDTPGTSLRLARDLAGFIAALREMDTRGRRFAGTGRGGSLPDHDDWMEVCFRSSEHLLDVRRLRGLWREMRALPRIGADAMTHGDLIPANLLVDGDRLVGVLDVGGFGPADPALDLVVAWHLLEAEPRREMRMMLGCDDLEWARGMAWAFQQSMGAVWYYQRTNRPMSRMGEQTLRRIVSDSY